jgi:hypothetical protein
MYGKRPRDSNTCEGKSITQKKDFSSPKEGCDGKGEDLRLVIAFPQSSFTTTIEKYEKLFPTEVHFQVTMIGYYLSHILIQGSGLRNEKV